MTSLRKLNISDYCVVVDNGIKDLNLEEFDKNNNKITNLDHINRLKILRNVPRSRYSPFYE